MALWSLSLYLFVLYLFIWPTFRQAGLATRRITLREIFPSTTIPLVWKKVTCLFLHSTISVIVDDMRMPVAA
jgi:hypothetical protein